MTPKGPYPALPLARADDLMVGETVIAVGNPFGIGQTVSTGVVSALGRNVSVRGQRFEGLIPKRGGRRGIPEHQGSDCRVGEQRRHEADHPDQGVYPSASQHAESPLARKPEPRVNHPSETRPEQPRACVFPFSLLSIRRSAAFPDEQKRDFCEIDSLGFTR